MLRGADDARSLVSGESPGLGIVHIFPLAEDSTPDTSAVVVVLRRKQVGSTPRSHSAVPRKSHSKSK
eukprot:COSAG02_NODE_59137_length_275_cov_0.590909_1_plen_66_part_10